MEQCTSRRGFVMSLVGGAAALIGLPTPAGRRPRARHRCHLVTDPGPHPEPRPGIDASRVLPPEDLADAPDLISLYDGIRAIPGIADGVRCQCGCANLEGFRSLLVCFEGNGMATMCQICQTQGRMVVRLAERGRSLDQIRAAVDARF